MRFWTKYFGNYIGKKPVEKEHPISEVLKQDLYDEAYDEVSKEFQNAHKDLHRAKEIRSRLKTYKPISEEEARFMGMVRL